MKGAAKSLCSHLIAIGPRPRHRPRRGVDNAGHPRLNAAHLRLPPPAGSHASQHDRAGKRGGILNEVNQAILQAQAGFLARRRERASTTTAAMGRREEQIKTALLGVGLLQATQT